MTNFLKSIPYEWSTEIELKNPFLCLRGSPKGASKVKGTIKTGQRFVRAGIKRRNTIRGLGSVLGSFVSAARSIWKKLTHR